MNRTMRSLIVALSIIVIGLLGIMLMLPGIISTRWGNERLINTVNSRIAGHVAIDHFELSWLSGQTIEGFTLEGVDGEVILSIEKLHIDQSLASLFRRGFLLLPAELVALNAYITQNASGLTNLQAALSANLGSLSQHKTNLLPFKLSDVNGFIEYKPDEGSTRARLTGKTEQDSLQGHFDLDGTVRKVGVAQDPATEDLTVSVRVENFPTAIIDQIAGLRNPNIRGLISSALGSYVNITVDEAQTGATATTYWDIQSPNLKFSFNGLFAPKHFALAQPAKAEMKITSDFISQLTRQGSGQSLSSLSLEQPATLVIWFHDLVLPWDGVHRLQQRKEMALNIQFDLSKLSLKGSPLPTGFKIDAVKGEVLAPKGASDASVHILGEATQEDQNFKIQADAIIDKPKDLDALLQSIKKQAKFHVETTGFPLVLIDQFSHTDSLYTDLLGQQVKLLGDLHIDEGLGNGAFSLQSDNLKIENVSFDFDKSKLSLTQSAAVKYRLTPLVASRYLLSETPLSLASDAHLQLSIYDFESPWSLEALFNKAKMNLNAELAAMSEVTLQGDSNIGELSIENARMTITGDDTRNITCESTAGLTSKKAKGALRDVFGANTQVSFSSLVGLHPAFQVSFDKIFANISGNNFSANFEGRYFDKKLLLTSPTSVKLLVTPDLLSNIGATAQFPQLSQLTEATFLFLTVAPPRNPWRVDDLSSLNITGDLSCDPLTFALRGHTCSVRDLMVPWEISSYENKVKFNYSGKALQSEIAKPGTFRGKCVIKDWLSEENVISLGSAHYKLKSSLVEFPGKLLGFFLNQPEFSTMVGESIAAEVDIQMRGGDDSGLLDLKVMGDQFDLTAALTFSDELTLKDEDSPSKLVMALTPERFEVIENFVRKDQSSPLELLDSTKLQVVIEEIRFPWGDTASFWRSAFTGKFSLGAMTLYDTRRKYEAPFQRIEGEIASKDLAERIAFTLKTTPTHQQRHSGSLDFNGTIENAFDDLGEVNLNSLSLDLKGIARDLHTYAFCRLFCPFPTMADKIEALLGDPLDANIEASVVKMNGAVKADLIGSLGKATLDGRLAQGVFTLNTPFSAEVKVTPKLGKYILHDVAPFLSSLRSSDEPMKIRIDPQGFSFPVNPFNRKNITIGLCSFSAGKMLFESSGQMKTILGLLGGNGKKEIPIWVTPLYIRMGNGIIKLERADMLLNNRYPIAAWGNVDIVKEKVDMIIGVTGTALQNALGIQSISSDYMLQVPLKGSLDNPKLDKKRAAAKISAIAVSGKVPQGAVIGTVLDIASGGLTEGQVPPPTTNPLPWAGQVPEQKEKSDNLLEIPKEQIEKGAKKLFKKLFK